MYNKILVKEEPIKKFAFICFLSAIISLGSGFIHRSISIIVAIFGYSLIVVRQHRFDKRRGLDPLSFSKKGNMPNASLDFNKQEMQLATIGVILILLSLVSGGIAPFAKRYILRLFYQ